ncbi:small ubiquitin-related modifier 3-like [Metopolophium dirhodum]|uniref:small ubiquitin-related modifier 3-like n=1 Tax=Metopolophium dirhodum TaxID=44670 RepID=UPI00298F61B9|nr:small ubiquitin-related modifier 3-like [Metopolophium dirhodum]
MTVLNIDTPPVDAPSPDSPPAEARPANGPYQNHINIKVCRRDGTSLQFLIKKTTPFDRLMKTYCTRSDLPLNGVRLRFNGIQVCRLDTPLSLEMEEGDFLEALHDF